MKFNKTVISVNQNFPYTSDTMPSLAILIQQEKKLPLPVGNHLRIALISSFTVSGLGNTLRVLAGQSGIESLLYEAPYKQYFQEIGKLDSNLYRFRAELAFVLLDPDSILMDMNQLLPTTSSLQITRYIKKHTELLINLLETYVNNSKTTVIFSLIPIPPRSVLGVGGVSFMGSKEVVIETINAQIRKHFINSPYVKFYDLNGFIMQYGWQSVRDPKMQLMGDYFISPAFLPQLGYELAGFIKAVRGKIRKCIVVDLDNTLWGGIIGEDGIGGIQLGPEPPGNAYLQFQKTLYSFYQRGVVLAINSNNNEMDIDEVFAKHPYMLLKREYFAQIVVNWDDKVSNMKTIAKNLDLGLESMVFVDDDPKKRAMIRLMLPEVLTVELSKDPAKYSDSLLKLNDFTQILLSDEDLKRGKLYADQTKRQTFKSSVTDLTRYLKELNLTVKFVAIDNFSIPRIAQLTQRTNQFNLTTKRYNEGDIIKFSLSKKKKMYAIEVIDKFGTYGIVGVLIAVQLDSNEWSIDTLLLSCRVLGLEVEKALIYNLFLDLTKVKAKKVKGEYISTAKNAPAENFFTNCGFKFINTDNKHSLYEYFLGEKLNFHPPAHIALLYENK